MSKISVLMSVYKKENPTFTPDLHFLCIYLTITS